MDLHSCDLSFGGDVLSPSLWKLHKEYGEGVGGMVCMALMMHGCGTAVPVWQPQMKGQCSTSPQHCYPERHWWRWWLDEGVSGHTPEGIKADNPSGGSFHLDVVRPFDHSSPPSYTHSTTSGIPRLFPTFPTTTYLSSSFHCTPFVILFLQNVPSRFILKQYLSVSCSSFIPSVCCLWFNHYF